MPSTRDRLAQIVDEYLEGERDPDFDPSVSDSDVSSMEAAAFMKRVDREFDIQSQSRDIAPIRMLGQLAEYIDPPSS